MTNHHHGRGGEDDRDREHLESLFVTAKTVETHLGHAYAKLEIGSRTELSRALDSQH